MADDKPIKKLNLKECRSALRKLKRQRDEMEEELDYIEHGIYHKEELIEEAKARIKLLTKKNDKHTIPFR